MPVPRIAGRNPIEQEMAGTPARQGAGGPLGGTVAVERDRGWLLVAGMLAGQELAGAAGMQLGGMDGRGIRSSRDGRVDLFLGATESSEVTTKIIRHQYLDMLRRCSFHTTIRITNRAMRILRAKRYSFAPAMLKPERKSPSIPTVEMVSPLKICAVHKEIIFDLLMRAPN